MNKFKTLEYEAGKLNVPKLINENLKKEYENQTVKYLIFVQTDIIENCIDFEKTCNNYCNFLDKWNIPFSYYSYYGRFNRVLPETNNIPTAKLNFNIKGEIVDVISQLAYGFLILDVEKLKSKNILIDESYPAIFYLQDLAEKCYKEDLWISNCYFFDIHDSWNMFKNQENNGYNISMKDFSEEKNRYNKIQRIYKSAQEFIEDFKRLYNSNVELKTEEVKGENK